MHRLFATYQRIRWYKGTCMRGIPSGTIDQASRISSAYSFRSNYFPPTVSEKSSHKISPREKCKGDGLCEVCWKWNIKWRYKFEADRIRRTDKLCFNYRNQFIIASCNYRDCQSADTNRNDIIEHGYTVYKNGLIVICEKNFYYSEY